MMKKAGKLIKTTMALSLVAIFLFATNSFAFADDPWADKYGFWLPDGSRTEFYCDGYGGRFSGIETYWDVPGGWTNPSTHKSLCNVGWPGSFYYNNDVSTPYGYLSGNAMFVFWGHGTSTSLEFYNPSQSDPYLRTSYIRDIWRANDQNWSIYLKDGWCSISDMLFAALIGCYTANGSYNIAYYMRATKGVDTVLGFSNLIHYFSGNCFNESFFYYACHDLCTVSQAAYFALGDVQTQLADRGYPNGLGGIDSYRIYGASYNLIYWPHFGN